MPVDRITLFLTKNIFRDGHHFSKVLDYPKTVELDEVKGESEIRDARLLEITQNIKYFLMFVADGVFYAVHLSEEVLANLLDVLLVLQS